MGLFQQETQVEQVGESRWQSVFEDNWCIGNVPNGGYVMAIAAKALSAALPHKDPMSVSAFYLAPTSVGPVVCDVEVLRTGGSTSFAMVRLYQQAELKVQVTAAFTDLARVQGETQQLIKPANTLTAQDCVLLSTPAHIKIAKHVNLRVAPGQEQSLLGNPQGEGRWDGWIDFRDDSPIDTFALMCFSDAYPPPVFTYYGPTGWVPTVELTVQVRAQPAPGPIQCQFTSRMMTDGITEEDGIMWDSSGKLVAISRQTAKFRLPK
ncbi:thioesterase family protein [Aestuariicella hydrocarbonica]|uniref:Thioesterase family protein n=1 Tax=Pseudomaricurvus hydrocarbonicus TaxID=1470433 RepID=A0A9E5MKM4_9GAMM|nr:thioesterase family protein [Aestuariicella hydrocarbonica]NHO65572.1 thioesterase family protein [Aestuariicella hydrocarbonica]